MILAEDIYISAELARKIDDELVGLGYSIEQLMEHAGLVCAQAIYDVFLQSQLQPATILIICGPGNNGGDGLVTARYLSIFAGANARITILYPNRKKAYASGGGLYFRLLKLAESFGMEIIEDASLVDLETFDLIVDAIFGFGFKATGDIRAPYNNIIEKLTHVSSKADGATRLISIDIPSGWDVENGPGVEKYHIKPDLLISLTAPKWCARQYSGSHHTLGGRFVSESLCKILGIPKIDYEGSKLYCHLPKVMHGE